MHVVGNGACDVIAEAALAIEMGALADDIGLTIHAAPDARPRRSWRPPRPASAKRSILLTGEDRATADRTTTRGKAAFHRAARLIDLGTCEFGEVWARQRELVSARQKDEIPDTLVFVEHPTSSPPAAARTRRTCWPRRASRSSRSSAAAT